MKYSELLQFEPITEVVKFDRLSDPNYRKSLVRTFVFSKSYEDTIIPFLCKNLDYTTTDDTFGLQIVGNYGTGKSHLMSLFTLIADNADYLNDVTNPKAKEHLAKIAGKYKVHRFEMGNSQELWDIVCYQIDKFLVGEGIDYSLKTAAPMEPYAEQIARMMAHFEAKYPDKGFMFVIDEMLSYLKGRSQSDRLNRDLAVLQALGQASDHSKFRVVFGVQEVIYNAPEFQFAATMLGRVNDRFKQITITKQDVKFVTEQRLLHKNDQQREAIRRHLSQFTQYFNDLHNNMEEYVELFPVHPAFFDNFQLVKIKDGQREILRTLSQKFDALQNSDVPTTEPGLISYDSYWVNLTAPDMQTDPDVHRINEVMALVGQKIDDNFVGPYAGDNSLAHRIARACGVKILQAPLQTTNGVSAETLMDDLCYLTPDIFDRDFLLDTISTVADKIVTATVGQYFVKNELNQEYHLRVVGGVNYEQKIKNYAAQQLTDGQRDAYFFNLMAEFLPLGTTYRTKFKIWAHRINWNSHKTMIDGYIFMGNPGERSTTHPQQHFYIYFMPVFNQQAKQRGMEEDSVYFLFDGMSQEMRDIIELYAAADSLRGGADSSQKQFYEQFAHQYKDRFKQLLNSEFRQNMQVIYRGNTQALSPQLLQGSSKEEIVSNIASFLLEDHFCTSRPNYPKFTSLRQPLTSDNFDTHIRQAKQKIANPNQQFTGGEAILYGLGLYKDGALTTRGSLYAKTIQDMMRDKGPQQVVNRDEILECFWADTHSYRSRDYGIEADFEYLVLATMVAMGEIEIDTGDKIITAANIGDIVNCPPQDYYTFTCIRHPRGLDVAAIRELSLGITGLDLSGQLDNPETLIRLREEAHRLAERCARAEHDVAGGIRLENIDIITDGEALSMRTFLQRIKGVADNLQNYNTKAKLKNYRFSRQELADTFVHKCILDRIERAKALVHDLSSLVSYLQQARQYVLDPTFISEITTGIEALRGIDIADQDAVEAYKNRLGQLRQKYAKWYLEQYKKYRITNIQEQERQELLHSEKLDALRYAQQSNYVAIAPQLTPWEADMRRLMPANSLSLEMVLSVPYQNFNPRDYRGVTLPSLADMRVRLNDIYEMADLQYHKILEDEKLLRNLDALNAEQRQFLADFKEKHITRAIFPQLMQIIDKLNRGIAHVNITHTEIDEIFQRQLTPDEAISAFRNLIENKLRGIDRSNARITLS